MLSPRAGDGRQLRNPHTPEWLLPNSLAVEPSDTSGTTRRAAGSSFPGDGEGKGLRRGVPQEKASRSRTRGGAPLSAVPIAVRAADVAGATIPPAGLLPPICALPEWSAHADRRLRIAKANLVQQPTDDGEGNATEPVSTVTRARKPAFPARTSVDQPRQCRGVTPATEPRNARPTGSHHSSPTSGHNQSPSLLGRNQIAILALGILKFAFM
ncbi:hypothetical protein MRX96_006845 [Rhipicephalus microplus]|uniref:Uncharacterized protein n=1 Tax=Rhipicephalus microplus TaxID=6941 RepID=A0A9J6DBL8_RHIMP|nr:hypothetical protein HPB51_019169 [Rhipicephalus microplus]